MRLSNRLSRPCAGSPLRMKLLKLSKVMRAAMPMVDMRPPFGASGLTQSKCLKSAGYLSSPKVESPCLGDSAIAPAGASTTAASSSAALRVGFEFVFTTPASFWSARLSGLTSRLAELLGGDLIEPPHLQDGGGLRGQLV